MDAAPVRWAVRFWLMSRFFGVPPQTVEVVTEQYVEEEWDATRTVPNEFLALPREALQKVLSVLGVEEARMPGVLQEITGAAFGGDWQEELYANLSGNDLLYRLVQGLRQPRLLSELREELQGDLSRDLSEDVLKKFAFI